MAKQSAALLLFRTKNGFLEVFLVHPGGPFWRNKDKGVWTIPKGEFSGEPPLKAAKRELKEETGYEAGRLERLTTFFTTPGYTDERIHLFMASSLTAGDSALESDEVLDLHQVRLSSALEMIDTGEIVDGKSMLGILLSAARLRV